MLAEIGWWGLALGAGLVAALAAVFLGRKDTPKWLSAPLFFSAMVLAGVGGFQSILDLRAPLRPGDCASAGAWTAEQLDALSVMVRTGKAEPAQQREFACALAAAIAPQSLGPESRTALVEAAAALSRAKNANTREAVAALQRKDARGEALDTLFRLAKSAEDFRKVGALAAAAQTERALAAYRAALKLSPDDAAATTGLGQALLRAGEDEAAERTLEAAAEAGQPAQWRAAALVSLSQLSRSRGDLAGAQRRLQEALALHEAEGDRLGQARAYEALSALAGVRGDRAQARQLAGEALKFYERSGQRIDTARAQMRLAELARAEGDLHGAQDWLRRAAAGFSRAHDPAAEARARVAWSAAALEQPDARTAAKQAAKALQLAESSAQNALIGEALIAAADAAIAQKRWSAAEAALDRATGTAARTPRGALAARAAAASGRLYFARRMFEPADAQTRAALALHVEAGRLADVAQARAQLGRIAAARGQPARARAELEQAVKAFDAAGEAASAARTREELAAL